MTTWDASTTLRQRRHLLLPLAAVLLVGAFAATSGLMRGGGPGDGAIGPDAAGRAALPADVGGGRTADTSVTESKIAFWQGRLARNPRSDLAWQYVGELYVQLGRETGDAARYTLADKAFTKALAIAPGNLAARAGHARVLATLHRFDEASAEALAVLQADAGATAAVAVLADAAIETGDLAAADEAIRVLVARTDGPAVQARIARLAYLRGDTEAASRTVSAAAASAAGQGDVPEAVAFYFYAAGEYRFSAGDLDGADTAYRAALGAFPGSFLALAGRGRVAFARGEVDDAIGYLRSATAMVPRPDLLAYLGDLYALRGDAADAAVTYEQVAFIGRLGELQAQLYNRELALFLASHGRDTGKAIELAAAELEKRKDIYGYDAYAWALYADGRSAEALDPARQANALGTRDARLLYHLGMIELADGLTADGRDHLEAALALNPAFDPLGAADARKALER